MQIICFLFAYHFGYHFVGINDMVYLTHFWGITTLVK